MGDTVEFKILGQMEVRINSQPSVISAAKHRVLLASLLLRFNRVVTVGELAERLWGDKPPRTARDTIQTYVQRLRRVLDHPDRVASLPGGYRVSLKPAELDLCNFRDLVARAREATELDSQASLLSRGLALWRGRALLDVPSDLLQSVDAVQLEEERLEALERWFDVELERGRHTELIPDLQAITKEYPLREQFHGQLMLALHRSGRQADVFDVYRRLRSLLVDELGVDPNVELRALYQRILAGDPDVMATTVEKNAIVDASSANYGQSVDRQRIPQELPRSAEGFVGRDAVRAEIVAVLTARSTSGASMVVVSGPPGVGKTALVVNVAHSLQERYPDGQLYADLRGYSSDSALEPEQLLARFLISLGVPAHQVSGDQDDMVGLYRSLLAGRRVLVVLDNVRSPAQVRPLLPSASGCAVLMTSRDDLRGLTAVHGAHLVGLGVLQSYQSFVLLANIIGIKRAGREMSAVAELAELCGHLPLALRIAAANLAVRHNWSITSYVDELRQGNRLAALEIEGDDEAAVRAAFRLSYETINVEAARVFRLLGLIPGPDFTMDAVTALANISSARAATLLDQLAASSLISRSADRRFHMHDLLRLYAKERCQAGDPSSDVYDARRRLFTFYLRVTDAAAEVLYPRWLRLPRPELEPGRSLPSFDDAATATSWMDSDCLNVCAAVIDAVNGGLGTLGWPMAEALRPYLVNSGRYRAEGLMACRAALQAAGEAGEHDAEAAMHNTIGAIYTRHAEHSQALNHYRAELHAYEAAGNVVGQARALVALGNVQHSIGCLDESAECISAGLRLAGKAGQREVSRYGWLNLGFVELQRGNLERAQRAVREVIALVSDTDGEAVTEGEARSILGESLLRQGRCAAAVEEFTKAVELYRRSSIVHYEANVLGHLSTAWLALGDDQQALEHARWSAAAARESGARDEQVGALTALASAQQAMGQLAAADSIYERALALCAEIGQPRLEITALIGMAENKRRSGAHDLAREGARRAAALSKRGGFKTLEAQAICVLAQTELDAGNLDAAQQHANTAIRLGKRTGALLDQARAWYVLGRSQRELGYSDSASNSWWNAIDCLAGVGLPPEAELSRLLAARIHAQITSDAQDSTVRTSSRANRRLEFTKRVNAGTPTTMPIDPTAISKPAAADPPLTSAE